MFCPSCEAEYREGFTECGDCGVALVEKLEPPAPAVEGLTPVLETKMFDELSVVADRLEKAGVPYVIEAGTALALLDGRDEEIPHGWEARISVASDFEERASRIVEQARHRWHWQRPLE